MKEKQPVKFNITEMALVLFCLTMFSFAGVSRTYAKHAAGADGSDNARVAAYILDVDGGTFSADLAEIQKPGDKKENISFIVKNNSGGKTSEVAEKYNITATLNGSLPLVCTIKKGSDTVLTLDAEDAASTPGTNPVAKKTSDDYELQAAKSTTDNFSISVAWPGDRNDLENANAGLSELVITVSGQQED